MVQRANVGPAPCPIGQLTADSLAAKLRTLASPAVVAAAQALAAAMAKEDGVGAAVSHFERWLPRQSLLCDASLLLAPAGGWAGGGGGGGASLEGSAKTGGGADGCAAAGGAAGAAGSGGSGGGGSEYHLARFELSDFWGGTKLKARALPQCPPPPAPAAAAAAAAGQQCVAAAE